MHTPRICDTYICAHIYPPVTSSEVRCCPLVQRFCDWILHPFFRICFTAGSPIHTKMSLEVDGRHGNFPVPCQRESEGFKYVNTHISCSTPPTAEVHDAVGTASEHVEPLEMSKSRNLGLGRRVRVRQSPIFCWSALFALVSVLAIVAAGVAGSIAARRGKHIDAWFVHCFQAHARISATHRP